MTPHSRVIRAAVVQAAPIAFDRERTLEKVRVLTADAASQGAHLVVFPEAFVSAYPRGLSFGAVVGDRSSEGREHYRRYWESAVDIPGLAMEDLARSAAQSHVYLVIGVIERDSGTLYCTVVFFASDGSYLGKHRKLMPTASERLIWGFGDGSTLPVFDTPIGWLGAVICWENYMPLLRMTMYGKGIQLYCAPTADGRDGWIATMQHIALEGRCFVLSCNQFARRSDYPTPYVTPFGDAPETVLSRGGSCIVNPLGQMLAGPNFTSEGIVTADLDLGDIARGKYDFDVVGHYARPDVFRLHVNEEPQPVVVGVTDPIRIECKEWKGSCRREWKVYLSSCQEERKPSRLGTKERRFALLIAVSLEELVPADHFYRHLECTLDVSFVRELVQQTCVGGGRPSLDPVVFFKLQLV